MLTLILLLACARTPSPASPGAGKDPGAALAAFFDRVHEEELDADPVLAAYLGVPHDETRWTSMSRATAVADHARAERHLAELRERFADAPLSEADRLSYRLFERRQERAISQLRWFWHDYRVDQMRGTHTFVPSFLTTVHPIDDAASARTWIARVRGVAPLFEELEAVLEGQEERGILPPAFAYPYVLESIDKLLEGAPFSEGPPSPLLAHVGSAVEALDLREAEATALIAEAKAALRTSLGPAYEALRAELESHAPTTQDGVWKLPDGETYYAWRLEGYTTTGMSAKEIHALGLREVARIHAEMRAEMPKLGVKGDLPELFAHLRTGPDYFLAETDEAREAYLAQARAYVAAMEQKLPEAFDLLPRAPLEVRRVPVWREGAAGKAFYQPASPDGTRPGIFYANLKAMANMPTYQLEALVYHEGVPGHHLQNAVSQELGDLPPFRRFDGYTAYGEGWGLYSELLPKELGQYEDPASNVGRLAMELWRAARLVVDTGIHDLRWTREEAIAYLEENTPNPRGDCVHAIERYIVTPGQATAYKVGMNEILRLRELAATALGDGYSHVGFHRAVLGSGPLPLDLLAEQVQAWIDEVLEAE